MEKNSIPIEINLVNEFIFKKKSKEGRHPFSLYKEFGVPIVTDDAEFCVPI
jgi:hypothetical protein